MVGSSWRDISLDVHGRDDVVDRLRAELLEILSGIRPWYATVQRVNFVALAVFAPAVLFLLFLIRIALRPNPAGTSTGSNPRMDAILWLIVIGTYASFLVVGFLLNRFRDSIFPRSVFLIGQGKARFQHLERIHWSIGIAFLVSLLAGIVVGSGLWDNGPV